VVTKTFAEFAKALGFSVDHMGFKQMTDEIAELRRGDPAARAKTDQIEAILHFSSGEMFSTDPKPQPAPARAEAAGPQGARAAPGSPEAAKARDLLHRIWLACSAEAFGRGIREAQRGGGAAFRAKRAGLFVRSIADIAPGAGFSLDHEGLRRMWASVALHIKDARGQREIAEIEDSMCFARGELLSAALGGEEQTHRDSQAHRDERARPAKPARARAG